MGFIRANRKQQVFFGYSLDEFVAADTKCRFVVDMVGELDLRPLYCDYSDQGGDAFDPSVMMAIWFFAYSEGVTSSREVENRCLRDTHFIYVSANLHPDHTSLSRFRKRHLELLPDLFVQIVRMAQSRGISGFRRICTDGTRIKANASPEKSLDSKALDKALAGVRSDIEEYLKECEVSEGNSGDLQQTEARLAELRQLEQKYEERKRQLEERKAGLGVQNRDEHRINITDPEALAMKKVKGSKSKRLFRDLRENLAEAMTEKTTSEAGTARMNERFGCSEPVFGNLKENLGFRSFRLRGLAGARGEYLLMCMGHNLNLLFRRLAGGNTRETAPESDRNAVSMPVFYLLRTLIRVTKRFSGFSGRPRVRYPLKLAA